MTPEAKVKANVVKVLKAHRVYYFFPATHGYGRSGVPDIVCCYKGAFIGVECKAGKGKPTALQLHEAEEIKAAGGAWLCINEHNISELVDLLGE